MNPILTLLQSLIDFIYGVIPRKNPSIDQCANAKVIVHRGWVSESDHLENTLEAFRRCLNKGLYGIEFDVRWTKDLIPLVHHDPTLKRLFGDESYLCDLTREEIKEKFPQIPTLEEVVNEFGGKLHLLIEIKEEKFPDITRQKSELSRILSPITEGKDYHLLSLTKSNFDQFSNFKKETMVLVSTKNPREISRDVLENGYGGFLGQYFLIGGKYISKHRGLKIGTGFPRNVNTFKREIAREGVDWIFTNHPQVFLKYREKRLLRISLNSRF